MKIRKPKGLKAVTTVSLEGKELTIHHQQSYRQAKNYQSAECIYGVTVKLTSATKDEIAAYIKLLEETVEEQLVEKITEQSAALATLGV